MTHFSLPRGMARVAVLFAAMAVAAVGGVAAPQAADDSADKGATPSRCGTFVEERNRASFEAYLAALTADNFAKALGYFAPGAVVVAYGSVPFAGTYSATDGAWVSLQQQYWDFSAGAAQEAPVLHADCDKVILNGSLKRVARAPGRSVDTQVIEYFTFDAQRTMARDDFYLADTAAVNAALGVP